MAGFDDGYVVVVRDMPYPDLWPATIQFSPDGVTWTDVRLPHVKGGRAGASSVATDGQRVVVVGNSSPCRHFDEEDPPRRCRFRPISWVSDDGRTWRESGVWTGPVAPAGWAFNAFSAFSTVWAVPTGGWDAPQAFYAGDEDFDGDVSALWHSENGLEWSLLRARPAEGESPVGEDCANPQPDWWAGDLQAHAAAEGRRVAIGWNMCEGRSSLSVSADGRAYERIGTFPDASGSAGRQWRWISSGLAPFGSGPWVFVGAAETAGPHDPYLGYPSAAMGWASPDLSAWTASVLPEPWDVVQSWALAVGHGAVGYVATGKGRPRVPADGSDVPESSITWLSEDGMTWRIAATGGTPIWRLADGPAGMLGFASVEVSDGVFEIGVWRLEPTP